MKENMDAATLVKQVLENQKQIEYLHEENRKGDQLIEAEIHRIKWDVYEPKIRALQEERDKVINKMQTARDAVSAERKKQTEALYQVIEQVKRILEFLRVQPTDLTIDDNDIHVRDSRYKENLGFIFRDEHLQIKLFIAENGKPKNKYSLLAFGKSSFNKELWERPYSYGISTYESSWYSLKEMVRDMPSVEEIKRWLATNRKNLVKQLLRDYKQVKREYLTVQRAYKIDNFALLLKLRCGKCGYFYTIFDGISMREEPAKCPECGEAMAEVKEVPAHTHGDEERHC